MLGNNFLVSGGAGDGTAVTTGSVTVLDIANQSVVADDLADGAVTSRTIASGAVTNRTIAEGAVNSFSIEDYSIQGQDIADGAITERKLSPELVRRLDQSSAGIKTANRGISMAFAMANVPQLSAGSDHSFGIAFGAFQGESALAIGLNSRFEDNAVGRFSISKSGKYWGCWRWGRVGMVNVLRSTSFSRLVIFCLVMLIGCYLGLPGLAQEKIVESGGGVKTSTLLNSGFEIVAANHLEHSIVLTLQRGDRAFFCEVNFAGATIQCVEIK